MKKVIDLHNYNKDKSDGDKHTKLFNEFISKFKAAFEEFQSTEHRGEFALAAWNFANLSTILPKDDFDSFMRATPKEDVDLLRKMITYKTKTYKQYKHFIIGFNVDEDRIVGVVTEKEEDYLNNILDAIEEDPNLDEADFEQGYINRKAIIMKPLQPFLDWYFALYPEDDDEDFLGETKIFLISDEVEDTTAFLRKKYDRFFKEALESYHFNKKEWPQKRNYKLFNQWFQVDISHVIYDLEKEPVFKM